MKMAIEIHMWNWCRVGLRQGEQLKSDKKSVSLKIE